MTALAAQHHWTPPSYGSVYGIVRHLSPAMVTLAQDGPAAFRDRYEFIYRHRAEGPNAIWQADHTLLDIPTVSLGVTSAVVDTYGCDDGRISPTRCAIIAAGLDGR